MDANEQRIAIAEACGGQCCYMDEEGNWMMSGACNTRFEPLFDLNAMHKAEKVLGANDRGIFAQELGDILELDGIGIWNYCDAFIISHASAAQRAEAFLKTIGKWKD